MSAIIREIKQRLGDLLETDPRIRNRLLATVVLLFLIIFLIFFDIQQGFSEWENINSKLSIFVALNINLVLLVLVFYLILKNILKLAYERHKHAIGVNLKTKLIISFLLLSFPATIFHLFASGFIASTLENWLTGQHKSVIHNAQKVADAYHRNLKNIMDLQGWVVEANLQRHPELLEYPSSLDHILTKEMGEGIILYNQNHEMMYQALRNTDSQKYWKPLSSTEWEQIDIAPVAWLVEELEDRFIYRHLRNMKVREQRWILEIFLPATKSVTLAINEIAEQEQNSKVIFESEQLVKQYYVIIFLFMTLFIIFVAIWLAFYLARGFVNPIEKLAIATQQVAEGALGYQVEKSTMMLDRDFELLIDSFNSMSNQLLENQLALAQTTENLRQSHIILEEHTRFVELVLENIKTGVMSVDMEGRVNGLNRAALSLLEVKMKDYHNIHYRDLLSTDALEPLDEMFHQIQQQTDFTISRNLSMTKSGVPVHVSMTALILKNPEGNTEGMIAVFENITEIQRLQRARAWREVARRIAHEIKNPLTPIQLSAERIRHKYSRLIEDGDTLDKSTKTIIREVEQLKKMVSEFSKFARLPESNPQQDNLNDIIEETVQLYHAIPPEIVLKTRLSPKLPRFSVDREQIKRVFINLIDNAIAAIDKSGEILIQTEYDAVFKIVRIDVIDSGPGIDPAILNRLFEPYATTKKHGTGLGLTIASQIISDHQGFIRHKKPKNGGACFSIELPAV
ncbi:MAG: PAS domain-containing protein [SAR324 cluster bacterium]|nr:PAS domain-containing protein [SAR324 cluster bacterium]